MWLMVRSFHISAKGMMLHVSHIYIYHYVSHNAKVTCYNLAHESSINICDIIWGAIYMCVNIRCTLRRVTCKVQSEAAQ
jgi:hypothetical protein